ncbi:MAG: hypothetical protein B9S34_14480 [Opitutia bacterium Tous-C1TDCM]|nr:MAG: hypothetical protein B9S34_14480 [Opitutae bacterium Tous-C1TDCM]
MAASVYLHTRLASALVRYAPRGAALEPHLHASLAQMAANPGKLLRAQLVLVAAEHHGLTGPAAEKLACAVEYYHAASLVIDDLPCMDDAVTRRGQVCVHRQHGEATAILAALGYINRAYALAGEALQRQPQRVRREATAILEQTLGAAGLVGGQAWDLGFGETDRSARTVGRIAAAKTGALFQLAILLPATLARPAAGERRALKALCVYWGLQFQIADDLRDVLCTSVQEGKTTGRDRLLARPNFALAAGVDAARARLERLARQSARALDTLAADGAGRWSYLQAFHAAISPALTIPADAISAAA